MNPGRLFRLFVALGLALAALSSRAQQPSESRPLPESLLPDENLTAEQFAQRAAMAGLQEVHLATMALKRAHSQEVKEFANEIIREHQESNKRLMQVAQSKQITLPPTNLFATIEQNILKGRQYVRDREQESDSDRSGTPAQEVNVAETIQKWNVRPGSIQASQKLQTYSGEEFDRAFLAQMIDDHIQALQLFSLGSTTLDDSELRRYAQRTLPLLRDHRQKASRLAENLSIGSAGKETKTETSPEP